MCLFFVQSSRRAFLGKHRPVTCRIKLYSVASNVNSRVYPKLNTKIRRNLTVPIDLTGLHGVKYRKTILFFTSGRGQGYGTVLCKSFKHGAKDGQAVDGLQ